MNRKFVRSWLDKQIVAFLEDLDRNLTTSRVGHVDTRQKDLVKFKAAIKDRINKINGTPDEADEAPQVPS